MKKPTPTQRVRAADAYVAASTREAEQILATAREAAAALMEGTRRELEMEARRGAAYTEQSKGALDAILHGMRQEVSRLKQAASDRDGERVYRLIPVKMDTLLELRSGDPALPFGWPSIVAQDAEGRYYLWPSPPKGTKIELYIPSAELGLFPTLPRHD